MWHHRAITELTSAVAGGGDATARERRKELRKTLRAQKEQWEESWWLRIVEKAKKAEQAGDARQLYQTLRQIGLKKAEQRWRGTIQAGRLPKPLQESFRESIQKNYRGSASNRSWSGDDNGPIDCRRQGIPEERSIIWRSEKRSDEDQRQCSRSGAEKSLSDQIPRRGWRNEETRWLAEWDEGRMAHTPPRKRAKIRPK